MWRKVIKLNSVFGMRVTFAELISRNADAKIRESFTVWNRVVISEVPSLNILIEKLRQKEHYAEL